ILPAGNQQVAATIPPVAVTQTVSVVNRLILDGNRALKEGKMAEAEASFKSALAQDSTASGARLGLAACFYMNGAFLEAKRMLGDVLRTDPVNSQALGLQGIIAWRENDLSSAASYLSRAIRQDPGDAQLHNYRGIVLHSQGFTEDAIKEFSKATELNPSMSDAPYNLAVALASLRKPRLDEARKSYQAALKLGYPRDDKLEQLLYAQP
ncbi:MAG: tetratricopeptide repeat protein, partial [Lentisphaerota bacterium]